MISRHLLSPGTLGSRTQTGPVDDFGSPTWVETSTAINVAVFPRTAEELLPGGATTWRGFYVPADGSDPASLVADAGDRIITGDGRSFEVDGPGRDWLNPRTKTTDFVEVDLEKVDR